jgi:hypothetical protein
MIRLALSGLLLLLAGLPAAAQTALEDAAAPMVAGEWKIVPLTNVTTSTLLEPDGNTLFVTSDASRGCWDPVAKEFHFVGQGHHGGDIVPVRHNVIQSDLSVRREVDGPLSTGVVQHGWNYRACDPRGRAMYLGSFNSLTLWRYTFADKAWTNLGTPPSGVKSYAGAFDGHAFDPDRGDSGQVIRIGLESNPETGILYGWDSATASWARIAGGTFNAFSGIYSWADWSRQYRRVYFGNNGHTVMRYLHTNLSTNADQVVQSAQATPCNLGINAHGIAHVSATTGNLIALCGPAGAVGWHIHNAANDTWSAQPTYTGIAAHIFNFASSSCRDGVSPCPQWGVVGGPLYDLGVNLYLKCRVGACQASLYRETAWTAADTSFVRRCLKPGVLLCEGFDSAASVAGGFGSRRALSNGARVTDVKASGTGALSFTISPGSDGSSTVWYAANFRDNVGKKKGPGQTFYVQFRQRFNSNFLSGTIPTFKQGMVGAGDLSSATPSNATDIELGGNWATSCNQLEVVWQHIAGRGYPINYHACPGTRTPTLFFDNRPCAGANNPLAGCQDQNDFLRQSIANCTRNGSTAGCQRYFANEWMTFKLRITPSNPWYVNNNVFSHTGIHQAWVCREGQACIQIYDFRPLGTSCDTQSSSNMPSCQTGTDHANTQQAVKAYGKMYLLPYSNGEAFPSGGQTWYDELIISENDIDDPGGSSVPTPPAAPTGLSVSDFTLRWVDASSDETGFIVGRRDGCGSGSFVDITTTAANATAFADPNAPGANSSEPRAEYQVRASNAAGDSAATPAVCGSRWRHGGLTAPPAHGARPSPPPHGSLP